MPWDCSGRVAWVALCHGDWAARPLGDQDVVWAAPCQKDWGLLSGASSSWRRVLGKADQGLVAA